jgi:hypothetical protein
MWICIRNTAFFLANLRICGLGYQGNFLICDFRINHYIYANLRFANRPQKFADLRVMRIFDLRTSKTICVTNFSVSRSSVE